MSLVHTDNPEAEQLARVIFVSHTADFPADLRHLVMMVLLSVEQIRAGPLDEDEVDVTKFRIGVYFQHIESHSNSPGQQRPSLGSASQRAIHQACHGV